MRPKVRLDKAKILNLSHLQPNLAANEMEAEIVN